MDTNRSGRMISRRLITLGSLLGLLIAGVCAGSVAQAAEPASAWKSPEIDQVLLGVAPDADATLVQMGERVGQSATSDGVTVTLDAVASDGITLVAALTVEREGGMPFEGIAPDVRTGAPGMTVSPAWLMAVGGNELDDLYGWSRLAVPYDADPSDPAIQLVVYIDLTPAAQAGGDVRLVLTDLKDVPVLGDSADSYDCATIAKGPWEFTFDFPTAAAPVFLPVDQPIAVLGVDLLPSSIVLTPLGVRATFEVPGINGYDERFADLSAVGAAVAELPVVVTLRDGRTIEMTEIGGGMSRLLEEGTARRRAQSPELIDVADVVEVTIGGTAIPVDVSKA